MQTVKLLPLNLDRNMIAKIAKCVAEHYRSNNIVTPEDIIKSLGGKIIVNEQKFDSQGFVTCEIISDQDFTVYLSHNISTMQTRKQLAHELGHYFLHHIYQREVNNQVQQSLACYLVDHPIADAEANLFANILIAEMDTKNDLTDNINTINNFGPVQLQTESQDASANQIALAKSM